MAMIIDFRSSVSRSASSGRALDGGAEIIIFPGVRRERHVEAPKPRRREKAKPKRDRIELPD
jgi:hypothetical protein